MLRSSTPARADIQAHEFIFNKYYHTCSNARVIFVLCCFALGAGVMALLGTSLTIDAAFSSG